MKYYLYLSTSVPSEHPVLTHTVSTLSDLCYVKVRGGAVTWMRNPTLPPIFMFSFEEAVSVQLEEVEGQKCTVLAQPWSLPWSPDGTESPALPPTSCVPLVKILNLPELEFSYLKVVKIVMATVMMITPSTLQASYKD